MTALSSELSTQRVLAQSVPGGHKGMLKGELKFTHYKELSQEMEPARIKKKVQEPSLDSLQPRRSQLGPSTREKRRRHVPGTQTLFKSLNNPIVQTRALRLGG